MKKHFSRQFTFIALSLCAALLSGCNGSDFDIAPVSGKVTLNGEPLSDVTVAFYPKGDANNPNPGPYSEAYTDGSGNYTLKTRYGNPGAVVATHRVVIGYDDSDDGDSDGPNEAIEEAKAELEEAKADGGDAAAASARLKELIAKSKARKKIPKGGKREFVVPSGGTSTADFELGKAE
jgi:hypothetical protein